MHAANKDHRAQTQRKGSFDRNSVTLWHGAYNGAHMCAPPSLTTMCALFGRRCRSAPLRGSLLTVTAEPSPASTQPIPLRQCKCAHVCKYVSKGLCFGQMSPIVSALAIQAAM
eukprot:1186742-Prorocentrum_minimum.AAC.6